MVKALHSKIPYFKIVSWDIALDINDAPVFIEYKDVAQNEFSHWEDGRLAMGKRKRNELKYFNLVSSMPLITSFV